MINTGKLAFSGNLSTVVHRKSIKAPLSWRLKNTLRWSYIWGWMVSGFGRWFSRLTGVIILIPELRAVLHHNGQDIDYGVVSRRVVTTAGATWLVDAWQGTYEPETMKYVGAGTGTTSEASGDIALAAECTTALNPDSTRATGTLGESSAVVLTIVGTLTFDASVAVTEHGIFNQAATGGGTLWDRSVFSAINVVSGDSITFTYSLTVTAGG